MNMYEDEILRIIRKQERFSCEVVTKIRKRVIPDYCFFDPNFENNLHLLEIKLDHNNLSRLKAQVDGYYMFSKLVSVVCSDKYFEKVKQMVPVSVGIFIIEDSGLKIVREPVIFSEHISYESILYILRLQELRDLKRITGYIMPKYNDFTEYRELIKMVHTIDLSLLYNHFIHYLIQRGIYEK